MTLSITFLGTSASRPTVERGVSAIALNREGEDFLIDCGEGTQRQMMRYGVGFSFGDIFFTHFHADHILGLVGLLRTMALQDRTEPLRLWGPKGMYDLVKRASDWDLAKLTFPLEVAEVTPGEPLTRKDFAIVPFAVDHRNAAAVGYALVEEERRGVFNPDLARSLGIPEGPLWGRIHKGEAITLDDGRVIEPQTLVGPTRPGRRIVITGDTRPCAGTIDMAKDADLLVHEATFGDDEAARAKETGHSTAREAAEVAAAAGVRRLVLTHFSARYSRDASALEAQARERFPAATVSRDGQEIAVSYRGTDSGQS